jgi:hypothetical protein
VGLRLVLVLLGLWPFWLATYVIVVPLAAIALTVWKPVRWTHAGFHTLALGLADPWLLLGAPIGPRVLIALIASAGIALFARSREAARARAGPR